MLETSVAHIIARTVCELEGKNWLEILPWQRDCYARIGLMAEDRIRQALLDNTTGLEVARRLVLSPDIPGSGKSSTN